MRKETGSSAAEVLEAGEEDLEKINQYTLRKFSREELFIFRVVLCNNDLDRDGEYFPLETLRQMETLYLGKTGLFDHSMQSRDQHARIFDTCVEAVPGRTTQLGEPFYCLRAKAYMAKTPENAALMRQIEAGITKEVSVGCAVGQTVCSICGASVRGEPCGHVPGKAYGGKRCGHQLKDALDAYEWSFVAVPAQPEAGVTKTYQPGQEVVYMEETNKDASALSGEEAEALRKEMDTLRQDAAAGRAYRDALRREVGVLCAVELPHMDITVFDRLSKTMDVAELSAFRKAFGGDGALPGLSQLRREASGEIIDNTVFKI